MINEIPIFGVSHMPDGGVKKCGAGCKRMQYAIEKMIELKLITIKK